MLAVMQALESKTTSTVVNKHENKPTGDTPRIGDDVMSVVKAL